MDCRHPCQREILADPQRQLSLSAGTQMQLTYVCVCDMLFRVWAVGGCERRGLFLFVLYWGNFASVCGVSVWLTRHDVRMHNINVTRHSTLICTGHFGYCYKRILVPMGIVATGVQNLQKFHVRVWMSYILTGVTGSGMKVSPNSQKFLVLWHGRTELTERPGRYKHAVPVPRVLWPRSYRNYISPGYGYECRTELTGVPVRVWISYSTLRSSL